jgi:type I restriction enzyme S subunit
MENPQGKFPAEFDTYQEVKKGDFIFCLFDVEETPRTVGLSEFDGMITGAYTVMKSNDNFDKGFLYHFYLNLDADKRMKPLYTGLRNTISKDNFFAFKTFVPPLPEQTRIAAFLDQKTAQIDQAIAQKERLIELLKERRLVYVNQILTTGLDLKCSFKDSKIEGLGQIPSHWEAISLKYLLQERTERSKNGEEPLLMVSQTHGLVVRADYHEKAMVAQSNVGNKRVYKNDLVFNKLKAHLGVFFKSNIEEVGIVSPDYAVYYPIGGITDLKFLELLFRHPTYIGQFICKATGIVEGLIRLYTSDLFSIKVPVPPIYEQTQILKRIETGTHKIDTAIAWKQGEIEKLKEYKATLINSVVTGKIKI